MKGPRVTNQPRWTMPYKAITPRLSDFSDEQRNGDVYLIDEVECYSYQHLKSIHLIGIAFSQFQFQTHWHAHHGL
jgi:hypothetical protein